MPQGHVRRSANKHSLGTGEMLQPQYSSGGLRGGQDANQATTQSHTNKRKQIERSWETYCMLTQCAFVCRGLIVKLLFSQL